MPLLDPPSDVVKVLEPLALALIDASTVWFTVEPVPFELFVKKFVQVFVSIVPDVYRLAVVVLSEAPGDKLANELVPSSNP